MSGRPSSDPSGQPMPVGDLPGWHQIFTDDFTRTIPLGNWLSAQAGKWNAYPYPWSDHTGGVYNPARTLSQHDGMLDIWLHSEQDPNNNDAWTHWSAAPYPELPGTTHPWGQTYGRYAIRFMVPSSITGYWATPLLWPDSGQWPSGGEIDFPENQIASTNTITGHVIHASATFTQDGYDTGVNWISGWHTAVIQWQPGSVQLYLDGKLIGDTTNGVPTDPMHWILQFQVLSGYPPADSTSGHVLIDWVAMWAKT